MGVILERKKRILLNEPHLVTTTPAGIANFSTDLIAPLKSCKVEFSPVQSGSGDPSPDNVRPISGWTGCNVTKCGKNLFDKSTAVVGKWLNVNTGFEESTSTSYTLSDYIPVKSEITYVMLKDPRSARRWLYDKDKNPLAKIPGMSFTPSVDGFCRITIYTPAVDIDTFQLELGSTATPYAPYTGTTIPIDWTTEAGIVYGGYVDLVTGELVAEWAAVDLGTLAWTKNAAYHRFFTNGLQNTIKCPPSGTWGTFVKCSAYKSAAWTAADDMLVSVANVNNKGVVYIKDTSHDDSDAATFKTAMSGVQLAYELATPVTYQLTPAQLKSLRGVNNIWSDANGDTTVKYWTH